MDAKILSMTALFGSQVSYRIPQFQRPYAWKMDDQWKPLWEDVRNVVGNILVREKENVPPHFLGAIVLQNQESGTGEVDKRIVVDGQQRLTTLQLLIRAAQDVFQSLDDAERANRLAMLTHNAEDHWAGDADNETKIRQSNLNDQRAFQEAIRGIASGGGQMRPIGEAFQYFKSEITDWLNERPTERAVYSDALEEALEKHLQVAAIDLDEGEKPHFIFAVLNTRAEPLKESDHIKNTVMYEANVIDDRNKADNLWGMFDTNDWWRQDTKEGRLVRIHLDRFLNYWLVMQLGQEVTAERVSSEFSNHVDQVKQRTGNNAVASIESITADVRKAGLIYQDMEEGRQPGIETFLRRVKTLEIGVVMPPLMWLYTNDVAVEKRQRCIQALESYLVRRMLCGLSSQGLNRFFIELVGRLKSVGSSDVDTCMIDFLSSATVENRHWPRDAQLAESLINAPMRGNASRQRMVLEAIELSLRSDMSEAIGDVRNLTVEHIMPQAWQQHWPVSESTEEVLEAREQAVKRIGNLTLVTSKLNPRLSNAPWSEKKETLGNHTSLRLNWELLNGFPNSWDESAIHERSSQLAEAVKGIWPYADRL